MKLTRALDSIFRLSAQTPGQRGAEEFLRAVTPEDIERLMREDEGTSHGNMIGAETGNPVHVRNEYMDADYPETGYNRPDRRYEDPTGEYGHFPGEEHPPLQDEYTLEDPRRYRISPHLLFGGDEEEDEEPDEPEWNTYHVGVRPRGTDHEPTEIRVHRLENPYESEPDEAWAQLMMEHPENFHEDNPNRSHDIMFVHPEDRHDEIMRDLADERHTFESRIAPHGLERESPDVLGHRVYRYEEPGGVVHRLWHSPYSVNGPGWHTSRYDPALPHEHQPVPWTEHPDNASGDSLGDALNQIEQNRRLR